MLFNGYIGKQTVEFIKDAEEMLLEIDNQESVGSQKLRKESISGREILIRQMRKLKNVY